MALRSPPKERVRQFWDQNPCGTSGNPHPPSTHEFFRWVESERDLREPFIAQFAQWTEWRDQRVLEMGVGAGTDHVKFIRAGAKCFGVDVSTSSVALTHQRLRFEDLQGKLSVSDVEDLPFPDDYFDFVYSWGVIHHTENTAKAAREALRVLKPGGRFCIMIYHRYSLVCLQAKLVYGLLRGRPFRSLDSIARDHLESFGTKVFSNRQALALFPGQSARVTNVMTPYDLRYARHRFLPPLLGRLLPSFLGYFLVVEGTKGDRATDAG